MKGISNGLVFDTETSTLIVSLKNCEYGDSDIYRTEKGNYFIHNIDDIHGYYIEYLKAENLEETISEWRDLGDLTIMFEEFELG
jgi:hypothetical protein